MQRRALLAGLAGFGLPAAHALANQHAAWTWERAQKAWRESGRESGLTEEVFDQIQLRRDGATKEVAILLGERFGAADPRVMQALREVPREYFYYHYGVRRSFARDAYESNARPWAIGFGSTISEYRLQAYMTQLASPNRDGTALEIGTGSGYQIALLSRLVKRAYSIEIVEPLGRMASGIFAPLGYDNIQTRTGDGYFGWPEVAGGFDLIMVTCVAQHVPPPLLAQLKPGGRIVVPIGPPFKREQFLYTFTRDASGKVHSRKDIGVIFVPMTGKIQAQQ
jgi:protein-L-isoaspartate(D-aspartate) O-methyltransferase